MAKIREFGFEEWVSNAEKLLKTLPKRVKGEVESEVKIARPISAKKLNALESQLGRTIPKTLRAFLERGSSGFEFSYKWTPVDEQAAVVKSVFHGNTMWGRGEFCKVTAFSEWLADCKSWAANTWVAEYPQDLAFWTQSFPILRMDCADFLALDQHSPADDPAVVYLSHDDESKRIAPSFTVFLREWERLHYVGPESWMIESFLDKDGFLSSGTEQAKILRRAYGDKV